MDVFLYQMNLTSGFHSRVDIGSGHIYPVDVDYDPIKMRIYWVDRGFDNTYSWLGRTPLGGFRDSADSTFTAYISDGIHMQILYLFM